jgi:hypothetical protein
MTSSQITLEVAARCRRDGGPLDTVEANDGRVKYVGAPYDALRYAKDLVFNPGFDGVILTTASGRVLDADAIKGARF